MTGDRDGVRSSISGRRDAARGGRGASYHQRRAEIIVAAAKVFRSKGYRGTSLADIAEAVGGDRATLSYYIGGKEELFDEIVTDVVQANLLAVEGIRDSEETAPDKVRRLVTQLMGSYAEHDPFLYVSLQENLAHVAEQRRPWAQAMRTVNRRYEAAVEAIIVQGIAEGSLVAITEPRVLAYGLLGMISWTHRWFNPEQSEIDADAIGTAYAQLLLSGLGARPVAAASAVGDGKRPARRGPEPTPATTGRRPAPHPDVARLVEQFAGLNVPTYDTVSVLHARALLEGVTRLQGPPQDVAQVRDILVPGAEGLLPARIYHPDPGRRLPMVVYFHGGGWVLGSIRAADGPCRAHALSLACLVGAIVVVM